MMEAVEGDKYSDGQKDVTSAAKKKGYPKTLIRKLGTPRKRGAAKMRSRLLDEFREKLKI